MLDKVKKIIAEYGQDHLLAFFDELSPAQQEDLIENINKIDFSLIARVYKEINAPKTPICGVSPMKAADSTTFSKEEADKYVNIGKKAIVDGKVGALTMCGGMGTRLGHSGPKGTFDIGLPSHKSLFEIQACGLKEVGNGNIPWYIMTSNINHDDTVRFFEEHNFFGYPCENIFFFKQAMISVLNKEGKILLENKGKILKSPNGNGGLFLSLKEAGGLDDMKKRGVEYLFICGIDNCLVKMADPVFVGYHISEGAPACAKSFMKRTAEEKAAIFCYSNGRPFVIEYTEIPEELASQRDDNGAFTYGDTNVLNYIFNVNIIDGLCQYYMPYHAAIKKVTYLDTNDGNYVTIPNGLKFELFLFDYFTHIEDLRLLRIDREQEFAPVKNPTGIDSVVTAREMYMKVHKEEQE